MLAVFGCVLLCGLSLGSGCPALPTETPNTGASAGLPIPPNPNLPSAPVLTFLDPAANAEVATNESFPVTFIVSDAKYNAAYTIWIAPQSDPNAWLSPDEDPLNANKRIIAKGFRDDTPTGGKMVEFTPSGLATGKYVIRGTATNGVAPKAQVTATGVLTIMPPGLRPRNLPPSIRTLEPATYVGVIHGDTVLIRWCAKDSDDKAKVLVLLDLDDDPTNDVVFRSPSQIAAICAGSFPRTVPGAILLGCFDENECVATTQPTEDGATDRYNLVIDVGQIPPRADGKPYNVRVDVADGKNPTVHGYASGGISVLPIINSASLDLGRVGRTVAGAVFRGFDSGGQAGSAFTRVPDLDGDRADEFIIVARYGRPFERGPMGSAFMLYGLRGRRFASEVPLNTVGGTTQGMGFGAEVCEATEGIRNVTFVPDLDNDGRPEILFGLPRVQAYYDWGDDDPVDGDYCYTDILPNPRSTTGNPDRITGYDQRESYACDPRIICATDGDLRIQTPIVGGRMVYISSAAFFTAANVRRNGFMDFVDVGRMSGNTMVEPGAMFRGAWYDFDPSQVDWPYEISPSTRFGESIASMPSIGGGSTAEILVSAPGAQENRGCVYIIFGQNMVTWRAAPDGTANSIPHYFAGATGTCYAGRGLVYPAFSTIIGSVPGDRLGFASYAGDFNFDGNPDILMGAPEASRDGMVGNGILYILFMRIDMGGIALSSQSPPRIEIHGVTPGEDLGRVQKVVQDISGDGIDDVAFGVPKFDPNNTTDAGMVGVLFGGRRLTGENVFRVTDVATDMLPGVRFLGRQEGGLAGASVTSAGDFNSDGYGDLLVVAPNETRNVGGQLRRGVAYLIFGGPHLSKKVFLLDQVGTTDLPGVVFVSPYAVGTAEEAPIEAAEAAGDVDGDGFGDILLGVPLADVVNPLSPSNRRNDAGEAYLIYGTNAITMNP